MKTEPNLIVADILAEMENVDSLALDWISGNLYISSWWTTPRYFNAKASISIMSLNGTYRRAIVVTTGDKEIGSDLQKPSCLNVDPLHGYVVN